MAHNNRRLSEDIKREVSLSIRDLGDERLDGGFAAISHCEVSADLSHCKIYVSAHGGADKTGEIVGVLQNAAGFFKRRINERIKMRKIPDLKFLPDNSLDYYDKIQSILDKDKSNLTGGNAND